VAKIEKFGAFVEIGAERPGLIHISELASYRVEEVSEIVKAGDEVEVKVIGVDPRKRQIKLSIKALEVDEPVEEETDETPLTAMQIALQRAMGDSAPADPRGSHLRSKDRDRQRRDQEDILSRTLTSKRK
jgi:small subunit ribosomal protein S1